MFFQNFTIVLKDNFQFEEELLDEQNIDPSPGNRGIFEVDEVLESEQIDDKLDQQIYEEYFKKAKEKHEKDEKKNKKFSFFKRRKK